MLWNIRVIKNNEQLILNCYFILNVRIPAIEKKTAVVVPQFPWESRVDNTPIAPWRSLQIQLFPAAPAALVIDLFPHFLHTTHFRNTQFFFTCIVFLTKMNFLLRLIRLNLQSKEIVRFIWQTQNVNGKRINFSLICCNNLIYWIS